MNKPGSLVSALAVGLLLAACSASGPDPADQRTPPAKPTRTITIHQPATIGQDIRYLDDSGTIDVLPVKDFRR